VTAAGTVSTTDCPRCEAAVPDGNFCGVCGCGLHRDTKPNRSPIWLRPMVFTAAPGQGVLQPRLTSSLFPHLPGRSRKPFLVVLIVAALGLMASAILRLPAIGIAIAALSLPLLFVLYLRASGAGADIARGTLVLAALMGTVLGVGWVLVSAQFVVRTYGVPMTVGLALHHLVQEGFLIPTVGMVLMVIPTAIIRLLAAGRAEPRESLDGFVIGALAALAFGAAATLTRLAPQINTGLIAHARPVKSLVVEVVLCGVTVPISAAAAGGMVGIALWFTRPPDTHRDRVRAVIVFLAAAALLIHGAVGAVDIIGMSQLIMLTLHLVMTVAVLVMLRIVLQLALLHEQHDPIRPDQPLLCTHCEHVVPDMAFCAACGVATRASSQRSRRRRRGVARPEAAGAREPGASDRIYPGFALSDGEYIAPALHSPRMRWLLSRWGVVLAAASASLAGLALVLTPKLAHYTCPPDCGKPPTGTPVMALPRFQPADGGFSVAYPPPGTAYAVTTAANGVTARYIAGDGGVMQLFSEPANGRSAPEVTRAILKRTYPDATVAYQIPNAMVGYQPGYGEVADDWPQNSTAGYSRVRVVIMVAVKNDLALVAFGTGPYHAFGPDFGPGPPSGANLELAQDMAKYVNSFNWKGDPDR